MNYWIISDTHFGHEKLIEYSNRPVGFEKLILKRLVNAIKPDDIIIHLGDFCIGNDEIWHRHIMGFVTMTCKRLLIRGNHDKKTNTWYLNHGWDFVAESIKIKIYGYEILFSHRPQPIVGYDLNVHGHLHNTDHHSYDPELKTNMHILVMLEHHYAPQNLKKLVGK